MHSPEQVHPHTPAANNPKIIGETEPYPKPTHETVIADFSPNRSPESGAVFDTINYTSELPSKYKDHLMARFNIGADSDVLEIGSGNGELSSEFAETGASVVGLDPAKTATEGARKNDKQNKVKWTTGTAEDFDFTPEKYNLVFSQDAFHLVGGLYDVDNKTAVMKKIMKGLKPGGFFGAGATFFVFNQGEAGEAFKKVFVEHALGGEEEKYENWTVKNFSDPMENSGFKNIETETVEVKAEYTIDKIAEYAVNLSRTASLSEDKKKEMKEALQLELGKVSSQDGIFHGNDHFQIIYGQKPDESTSKILS